MEVSAAQGGDSFPTLMRLSAPERLLRAIPEAETRFVVRATRVSIGKSMKIEADIEAFIAHLSGSKIPGFHGTSALAGHQIEKCGFLPNKLVDERLHQELLNAADALKVETGAYRSWLSMRSVTFARKLDSALEHIRRELSGSSRASGASSPTCR